jgi:hypothetical protein
MTGPHRTDSEGPRPAQPAATNNVLTTLDERPPTALYWQLTLLATLGGFLFGYNTSNIVATELWRNCAEQIIHTGRRRMSGAITV